MKNVEITLFEKAQRIDYSILKPEFTESEIVELTKDAVALKCATVCINPVYIKLCEPYVKDTETKICPVCDFPFGTSSLASRKAQLMDIINNADYIDEIDVVSNYGSLKSKNYDAFEKDLRELTKLCHRFNKKIKVILETDALELDEVIKGSRICNNVGVDFVKTSTGFLTGHDLVGGTPELMKEIMAVENRRYKVKASGNIRTQERFETLLSLGVDRCGVGYKSVKDVLGV